MKKYIIVKEEEGFMNIVCGVSCKEIAEHLVKALNEKSEANRSSLQYHIYELIKD